LNRQAEPTRELLVVHHDDDTPENRAAAEKSLQERGVECVRHTTAFSIIDEKTPLRSDGFVVNRQPEPTAPHAISGREIVEGSKRAAEAADAETVEQMRRIAGKVHVLSAFHCDFGCDVPSHKPGCPFYVNRPAEPT
jgi:hypothetical protein